MVHKFERCVMKDLKYCSRFMVIFCLLILSSSSFLSDLVWAEDEMRIAILDFDNFTGLPQNDKFRSGISESMNVFISKAEGISAIERKRMRDALDELALSQAGLIKEDDALEVGKFLQANLIIVGSFLYENNIYRITCRALEVETSLIRFADQSENREIYRAIDDLSIKILRQLGYEAKEAPKPLIRRMGPWTTLLLSAVAGGGTFLMNQQGNDSYDKYLQTVDPQKMNSYYDDAKSFDMKRNIMIGVSSGVAILTVYLFKTQMGKEWEIRKIGDETGQGRYLPLIAVTTKGTLFGGKNLSSHVLRQVTTARTPTGDDSRSLSTLGDKSERTDSATAASVGGDFLARRTAAIHISKSCL